jgi:hypothetical protein
MEQFVVKENYEIPKAMNFWSWSTKDVVLATIKLMNFDLVH